MMAAAEERKRMGGGAHAGRRGRDRAPYAAVALRARDRAAGVSHTVVAVGLQAEHLIVIAPRQCQRRQHSSQRKQ